MSMSAKERKLPQYCRYKCRSKSFKPHEGKFVDNNRFFVCYDCINSNRRKLAKKAAYKISDAEAELIQALHRSGKRFKHRFRIDKWEYDFAFVDERILLEIDGSAHDYSRQQAVDTLKSGLAKEEGWTVIRVKYGPGLIRRVAEALGS